MAFPDLTRTTGGVLHSSATGLPVNGANTFAHNLQSVVDTDWVDVTVVALGPSITAATLTSVTATQITVNFTQTGADQATVYANYRHTIIR